ncbi:MAG TPA: anti-sigma F factor [Haloplasmataceae bacterium]
MRKFENYCEVVFDARSENESFARIVVAGFVVHLDPRLEELNELKTAVSEAVTNAIIHAYDNKGGTIKMTIGISKGEGWPEVTVTITDYGKGIPDVQKAREIFYTTRSDEERSGMGFTLMEAFSDELYVHSEPKKGTTVTIIKRFPIGKIDDE